MLYIETFFLIYFSLQDIQQLLQLQQLVLMPGHHLQSPAQFLLSQPAQAQQQQQGEGNGGNVLSDDYNKYITEQLIWRIKTPLSIILNKSKSNIILQAINHFF